MIKTVIKQLNQEQYSVFHNELLANKGEKLVTLLKAYRTEEKNDDELMLELSVNSSSFYTLRSRLYEKVRNFLFINANDEEAELMKNVHSLDHFVFNNPKETSIALLIHLENELIRLDMQSQLISVYNALKKLHINTEKYYHYEQQYNKSVAYMLSQAKAEELLLLFSQSLTSFLLSRAESEKEVLILYLQEIYNLTLLYDSSRLLLFHKIGYLNYLIFIDHNANLYYPKKTTEELLSECQTIIDSSNKHVFNYPSELCIRFLHFHYFHRLRLYKNNTDSLEELMSNSRYLLNLYALTSPYYFFISILERYNQEKTSLNSLLSFLDSIDETKMENDAFYIYQNLAYAVIYYNNDQLSESYNHLQNLINFPPLKKFGFIEHEIKLFHVFTLLLLEKTDLAESSLRSLTRKSTIDEAYKEQSNLFIQILKAALSNNSTLKQKKIFEAFKLFTLLSKSENTILSYLPIQEKHILQLSMS